MDRAQLTEWIAGYERAWRAPGIDALANLFAEDATYSTAPYENPHQGLSAIGEMWEADSLNQVWPAQKKLPDLWWWKEEPKK